MKAHDDLLTLNQKKRFYQDEADYARHQVASFEEKRRAAAAIRSEEKRKFAEAAASFEEKRKAAAAEIKALTQRIDWLYAQNNRMTY